MFSFFLGRSPSLDCNKTWIPVSQFHEEPKPVAPHRPRHRRCWAKATKAQLGMCRNVSKRRSGGNCCNLHGVCTFVLSNCACSRMFTSWKKRRNNAKNGIGKCKSERGTHDNCRKNGKAKCKLKRGKNCKWMKHRKSKCNLERGTFDKWRTHGRNQCKLEGCDMICREYRQMKCNQGKGKCQMQHTLKHQINLDKVVKPAQKTKETLNLKREVRGEPVKPKNAQCRGSRLPSGQVASRKGRSPIRIGDL